MNSSSVFCHICNNIKDPDCYNEMCSTCCPIQAVRSPCTIHDESFYCKEIKSKYVHDFI